MPRISSVLPAQTCRLVVIVLHFVHHDNHRAVRAFGGKSCIAVNPSANSGKMWKKRSGNDNLDGQRSSIPRWLIVRDHNTSVE
jgi:hypothetical protein